MTDANVSPTPPNTSRRLLAQRDPELDAEKYSVLVRGLQDAVKWQQSLRESCAHVRRIHQLRVDDTGFWMIEEPESATSLESLLKDEPREPLDQDSVIRWGIQMCEALMYACYPTTGLVRPHGALRPPCVFLVDEQIEVSDFGIATAYTPILRASTASDELSDELELLAPYTPNELWGEPGNIGELADQFAVGVILYECATGSHPYGANRKDPDDCKERIVITAKRRSASEAFEKISSDLAAILDKAVAKEERKRFSSIRELHRALIALGELETEASPPPPKPAEDDRPHEPVEKTQPPEPDKPPKELAATARNLLESFVHEVARKRLSSVLPPGNLQAQVSEVSWECGTEGWVGVAVASLAVLEAVATKRKTQVSLREHNGEALIVDRERATKQVTDAVDGLLLSFQGQRLEVIAHELRDKWFPGMRWSNDLRAVSRESTLNVDALGDDSPEARFKLKCKWNSKRQHWTYKATRAFLQYCAEAASRAVSREFTSRAKLVPEVISIGHVVSVQVNPAETPKSADQAFDLQLQWRINGPAEGLVEESVRDGSLTLAFPNPDSSPFVSSLVGACKAIRNAMAQRRSTEIDKLVQAIKTHPHIVKTKVIPSVRTATEGDESVLFSLYADGCRTKRLSATWNQLELVRTDPLLWDRVLEDWPEQPIGSIVIERSEKLLTLLFVKARLYAVPLAVIAALLGVTAVLLNVLRPTTPPPQQAVQAVYDFLARASRNGDTIPKAYLATDDPVDVNSKPVILCTAEPRNEEADDQAPVVVSVTGLDKESTYKMSFGPGTLQDQIAPDLNGVRTSGDDNVTFERMKTELLIPVRIEQEELLKNVVRDINEMSNERIHGWRVVDDSIRLPEILCDSVSLSMLPPWPLLSGNISIPLAMNANCREWVQPAVDTTLDSFVGKWKRKLRQLALGEINSRSSDLNVSDNEKLSDYLADGTVQLDLPAAEELDWTRDRTAQRWIATCQVALSATSVNFPASNVGTVEFSLTRDENGDSNVDAELPDVSNTLTDLISATQSSARPMVIEPFKEAFPSMQITARTNDVPERTMEIRILPEGTDKEEESLATSITWNANDRSWSLEDGETFETALRGWVATRVGNFVKEELARHAVFGLVQPNVTSKSINEVRNNDEDLTSYTVEVEIDPDKDGADLDDLQVTWTLSYPSILNPDDSDLVTKTTRLSVNVVEEAKNIALRKSGNTLADWINKLPPECKVSTGEPAVTAEGWTFLIAHVGDQDGESAPLEIKVIWNGKTLTHQFAEEEKELIERLRSKCPLDWDSIASNADFWDQVDAALREEVWEGHWIENVPNARSTLQVRQGDEPGKMKVTVDYPWAAIIGIVPMSPGQVAAPKLAPVTDIALDEVISLDAARRLTSDNDDAGDVQDVANAILGLVTKDEQPTLWSAATRYARLEQVGFLLEHNAKLVRQGDPAAITRKEDVENALNERFGMGGWQVAADRFAQAENCKHVCPATSPASVSLEGTDVLVDFFAEPETILQEVDPLHEFVTKGIRNEQRFRLRLSKDGQKHGNLEQPKSPGVAFAKTKDFLDDLNAADWAIESFLRRKELGEKLAEADGNGVPIAKNKAEEWLQSIWSIKSNPWNANQQPPASIREMTTQCQQRLTDGELASHFIEMIATPDGWFAIAWTSDPNTQPSLMKLSNDWTDSVETILGAQPLPGFLVPKGGVLGVVLGIDMEYLGAGDVKAVAFSQELNAGTIVHREAGAPSLDLSAADKSFGQWGDLVEKGIGVQNAQGHSTGLWLVPSVSHPSAEMDKVNESSLELLAEWANEAILR